MFKNFIVKFPSKTDVYALINGELTACKVLGVTVDTEKCESFVVCESPDGFKNSFDVTELYSSVEAYEKGNTVSTLKPELSNILPGCYEFVKEDENHDRIFNMTYWVMVDGEPKKVCIDAKRIEFDNTRTATNIKLPAEVYKSREECIQWNDINIVEEDGSKRVQKSTKRALMLTDEQRAIIDEVRAAMEKAKAAGVVFGYNHDYMEWIGLNKTEYPDLKFEWCDSISEEEEKNAIWCNRNDVREHYRIDLPLPAYVTECERVIIPSPKK